MKSPSGNGLDRGSPLVCQGLPDLAGELRPSLGQVLIDQLLAVIEIDCPNGFLCDKTLQPFRIVVIGEKDPAPARQTRRNGMDFSQAAPAQPAGKERLTGKGGRKCIAADSPIQVFHQIRIIGLLAVIILMDVGKLRLCHDTPVKQQSDPRQILPELILVNKRVHRG